MLEKIKNIKPVYLYLSAAPIYWIGQTFIDSDSILYDLLGVLCISIIVFAVYKFLSSK
jgi:hypothetical protein